MLVKEWNDNSNEILLQWHCNVYKQMNRHGVVNEYSHMTVE